MTLFATYDKRFGFLAPRHRTLYVVTATNATDNQYFDGEKVLTFFGWHTDWLSASNAARNSYQDGNRMARVSEIASDDDVVYVGGANSTPVEESAHR